MASFDFCPTCGGQAKIIKQDESLKTAECQDCGQRWGVYKMPEEKIGDLEDELPDGSQIIFENPRTGAKIMIVSSD